MDEKLEKVWESLPKNIRQGTGLYKALETGFLKGFRDLSDLSERSGVSKSTCSVLLDMCRLPFAAVYVSGRKKYYLVPTVVSREFLSRYHGEENLRPYLGGSSAQELLFEVNDDDVE